MHKRIAWEKHLRGFKPVAGKTLICIGRTPEKDQILTFGDIEPSWNICTWNKDKGIHIDLIEDKLYLRGRFITQVYISSLPDINTLREVLTPAQREGIVNGSYDVLHGDIQAA